MWIAGMLGIGTSRKSLGDKWDIYESSVRHMLPRAQLALEQHDKDRTARQVSGGGSKGLQNTAGKHGEY